MAIPVTYTIFNNSSTQSATIGNFVFATPAGIVHASTLTNFGIIGVFTGTTAAISQSMLPGTELTFISHYTTTTTVLGDYTGTVAISALIGPDTIPMTVTNTVIISTNPIPNPYNRVIAGGGAEPSAGGGDGGWDIIPLIIFIAVVSECFTAGTQVLMADKTVKNIEDVVIGDRVYNQDGTKINTVKYLERALDSHWGELYSPNIVMEPFITINHPIYIGGELHSPDAEKHYDNYPWLGSARELGYIKTAPAQGRTVYNLWVDGDHTFTVNGYGTTSIINDGAFLRMSAEDGFITFEDTMRILQAHSNNGRCLRVGSLWVNEFLGWLNFKPLSKRIAKILAGNDGIAKSTLWAIMRTVGLAANIIYDLRK